MGNTLLFILASSVASITEGQLYEFSRGYSYDMSRCVMTEVHEIFDYGDGNQFNYVAKDDSFTIKKKDGSWSVVCKLETRTETDYTGKSFTLPHSQMDYGD